MTCARASRFSDFPLFSPGFYCFWQRFSHTRTNRDEIGSDRLGSANQIGSDHIESPGHGASGPQAYATFARRLSDAYGRILPRGWPASGKSSSLFGKRERKRGIAKSRRGAIEPSQLQHRLSHNLWSHGCFRPTVDPIIWQSSAREELCKSNRGSRRQKTLSHFPSQLQLNCSATKYY